MPLTDKQLKHEEELDELIYSKLKGLFEASINDVILKVKNGQDVTDDKRHIINAYNTTVDSAHRLMGLHRRAQNDLEILQSPSPRRMRNR